MLRFFISAIFVMLSSGLLFGQVIQIDGIVTDQGGEALREVRIWHEKSHAQNQSNRFGVFFINVLTESGSLSLSKEGYLDAHVAFKVGTPLKVQMRKDPKTDKKQIISAFGKAHNVSDVSHLGHTWSKEDFTIKSQSLGTFIGNRIIGLNRLGGQQITGHAPLVQDWTLTQSKKLLPLIVIDGFPMHQDLSAIEQSVSGISTPDIWSSYPLEDVESVSFIPAGSAAILYGLSAAGGVVLVKTKMQASSVYRRLKVKLTTGLSFSSTPASPDGQDIYAGNWGLPFNHSLQDITNRTGKAFLPTTSINHPFETAGMNLGEIPFSSHENWNSTFGSSINWNRGASIQGFKNDLLWFGQINSTNNQNLLNGWNGKSNQATLSTRKTFSNGVQLMSRASFSQQETYAKGLQVPGGSSFLQELTLMPKEIDLASNYLDFGNQNIYFEGRDNPLWLLENYSYKQVYKNYNIGLQLEVPWRQTMTWRLNVGLNKLSLLDQGTLAAGSANYEGNQYFDQKQSATQFNTRLLHEYKPASLGHWNLSWSNGIDLTRLDAKNDWLGSEQFWTQDVVSTSDTDFSGQSVQSQQLNTLAAFTDFKLFSPFISVGIQSRLNTGIGNNVLDWNGSLITHLLKSDHRKYSESWGIDLSLNSSTWHATEFGQERQIAVSRAFTNQQVADVHADNQNIEYSKQQIGLQFILPNDHGALNFQAFHQRTSNVLLGTESADDTWQFDPNEILQKGITIETNLSWFKKDNPLKLDTRFGFRKVIGIEQVGVNGTTAVGANGIQIQTIDGVGGQLFGYKWQEDDEGALLIDRFTGLPIASEEKEALGQVMPDFTLRLENELKYKNLSVNMVWMYQKGGNFYSPLVTNAINQGWTTNTVDREGFFIVEGLQVDANGEKYFGESNQPIPNDRVITSAEYYNSFSDGTSHQNTVFDATHFRLSELRLSYHLDRNQLSQTVFKEIWISLLGENLWYLTTGLNNGNGGKGLGLDLGQLYAQNQYGIEHMKQSGNQQFSFQLTAIF